MKQVIKILVVICCIPLLVFGISSMFFPSFMIELCQLKSVGTFGLQSIRANFGGLFFSGVVLSLLGLYTKNKTWYQATLILVSIILFGRIISILLDGWTNLGLPALVIESTLVVVLLIAIKNLETFKK